MKVSNRYKLPDARYASHRDGKHSVGNTVNNVVITFYGDRWQLHL